MPFKERHPSPMLLTCRTAPPASGPPLLCPLHTLCSRTQYAAKHWHSGTAAGQCDTAWVLVYMFACGCIMCLPVSVLPFEMQSPDDEVSFEILS